MPADLGTKPLLGPRIKLLKDLMGVRLSDPDQKEADDDAMDVPDLQKGEVKNESFKLHGAVTALKLIAIARLSRRERLAMTQRTVLTPP